ncbi:MAG: 6-phosphogluconolactonase [Proteobacteria bacterium]|nr:6-phosphogluconolactonase [Pseudomonadota bacterium]
MPRTTPRKEFTVATSGALARRKINKKPGSSVLIREEVGFHMGIAGTLSDTALQAADLVKKNYTRWLKHSQGGAGSNYRQNYFTIAVGGGNTVKAEYRALLERHHSTIDWIKHVRFFFLEESSGEKNWESSRDALIEEFLSPLASKLLKLNRPRTLAAQLGIVIPVSEDEITACMIKAMVNSINLVEVNKALRSKNKSLAKKLAQRESERYQRNIKKKLGSAMSFHMIISGIGKDGGIGALSPYTPELKNKRPGSVVLQRENGSLRVALNRGVFIGSDCISLIISGNLKLKALGRFEMEESADFEQTVLETPLRMLRETKEIAQKVYIFADEQALHVDETVFRYTDNGNPIEIKAETREGEEDGGIHILLMHGFMGLFSFTSLLLRLPSAWTVSALHRGSYAKSLKDDEIFAHYALSLRKAILKNWRSGRPTPIVGHSIAGVISDHLLLSIIGDYDGLIPPYSKLKAEDKQLVDALRAGGIINLATWAPTDAVNTGKNVKNLISHMRQKTALNYSGFEQVYTENFEGQLQPHELAAPLDSDALDGLGKFLSMPGARTIVHSFNLITRALLKTRKVQQKMLNTNSPYILRIVGGRLLKKISFYGMLKEVNAALHDPREYQARHIKTLDILLRYDIPVLSIVHKDDFLVSANRHREEQQYLLRGRLKKEGVKLEQNLQIPARYVLLQREQEELPVDLLNPHLLVMSTSNEGNKMIRQITSAITEFVNENVDRTINAAELEPLASIKKWKDKKKPLKRQRRARAM